VPARGPLDLTKRRDSLDLSFRAIPSVAPVPTEAAEEGTDPLRQEPPPVPDSCSCDAGECGSSSRAHSSKSLFNDPCQLAAPMTDEAVPLDTGLAVQFRAPASAVRPSHWSSSLTDSQGKSHNSMVSPWLLLLSQGTAHNPKVSPDRQNV